MDISAADLFRGVASNMGWIAVVGTSVFSSASSLKKNQTSRESDIDDSEEGLRWGFEMVLTICCLFLPLFGQHFLNSSNIKVQFLAQRARCNHCGNEYDFPLFWLLSQVEWSIPSSGSEKDRTELGGLFRGTNQTTSKRK
jgi:hypothetical protein